MSSPPGRSTKMPRERSGAVCWPPCRNDRLLQQPRSLDLDGQRGIRQGGPMSSERFPGWVYSTGDEPDPRFSLANERTYLAWIRTALALIACGVALEALGLPLQPVLRLAASILLIILGTIVPLLAWVTWGTIERAMRAETPLPGSRVSLPVGIGVTLVGVLIALGTLLP
jgi:putative membrane protein